jgi:hypothetical protein
VLNALVDEHAAMIPRPQFIDWWRGLKQFAQIPNPLSVSTLNATSCPCGTALGGKCLAKDGSAKPFLCTEEKIPKLGCNHTAPGSNSSDGMFYTDACLASGNLSSCLMLVFVDPSYDQGYAQSFLNNLGVKAAFAFPGWGASQMWLQARVESGEPVLL